MSDYFDCPAVDDSVHGFRDHATYRDHNGVEIHGEPLTRTPYTVVCVCMHCKCAVISYNMVYPHAFRWDNRRKSIDALARGGWTRYEGEHQLTQPCLVIHEEPV